MTSTLEFIPLHDTFVAECRGVDSTKPIPPHQKDEIREATDKVRLLVPCATLAANL